MNYGLKERRKQPVLWGVMWSAIRFRWRQQLLTAGSLTAAANTCTDFWWSFFVCAPLLCYRCRGPRSVKHPIMALWMGSRGTTPPHIYGRIRLELIMSWVICKDSVPHLLLQRAFKWEASEKNSIISSHQFLPSRWRQTLKCDPGAANTFEILVA